MSSLYVSGYETFKRGLYVLSSFSAIGHPRSPFVGAHVPSVLREEPVVTFEIFDSVLSFTIDGLMQILYDFGACRFRSAEVRINVIDEHCQGLSRMADLRRT